MSTMMPRMRKKQNTQDSWKLFRGLTSRSNFAQIGGSRKVTILSNSRCISTEFPRRERCIVRK